MSAAATTTEADDVAEFDCADCGLHVFRFVAAGAAAPTRCFTCDFVAARPELAEKIAAMRDRAGLPLPLIGKSHTSGA